MEATLRDTKKSPRNSGRGAIRGKLQPSRQADLAQSIALRELLLYTNPLVVRKYSRQTRCFFAG